MTPCATVFGSYFSPTGLNDARRIAHVFDVAFDSTRRADFSQLAFESITTAAIVSNFNILISGRVVHESARTDRRVRSSERGARERLIPNARIVLARSVALERFDLQGQVRIVICHRD